MPRTARELKAYLPTEAELKFIEDVQLRLGNIAGNAAASVIHRWLTGFGDHLPMGMETAIRELARHNNIDLPC